MVLINVLCRLCLVNSETETSKLLIKLTEGQKDKFEELTEVQLPLTDEYPSNVCTDCSDHLENFYFFKSQLIKKQNDLNLFISSQLVNQEPQGILEEAIQDDFIEFDEEIELLTSNDTENFIEDIELQNVSAEETTVYREELKFEKTNPQLILFPSDLMKSPEKVTSDLESPLIDEKPSFKCKSCNLNFKLKLSYEGHMKNSHAETKFICPTCGNIYVNKRDLRSHLRSHNFNKKYKCSFSDICSKSFRHQHHLINHLRVHTKKSPFVCSECNQTFRQKYAMTLHMKKHAKDFIECSKCKSQFIRPIQLTKHLENNLCDGVFRPYLVRNKKNKN